MARGAGIFVCLLIVVMDLGAGFLGIRAEVEQNKVCLKFTLFLKYMYKYNLDAVKSIINCNICFTKQVKHLRLWIFECREPSREAFLMGLGAAALLGLAHVLANLLGGCNCICTHEELAKAPPNRQLSVACLILTWYVFFLLVSGTKSILCTYSKNQFEVSKPKICFKINFLQQLNDV